MRTTALDQRIMAAALRQIELGTGPIGHANALGRGIPLDETNAGLKPSTPARWAPIEGHDTQSFDPSPPRYELPSSFITGRRVMENATNGTGQPNVYAAEIIRQTMMGENVAPEPTEVATIGALAVPELILV